MKLFLLALLMPVAVLALGVVVWDLVVRINGLPPYVLPSPGLVLATLVADGPLLMSSAARANALLTR